MKDVKSLNKKKLIVN